MVDLLEHSVVPIAHDEGTQLVIEAVARQQSRAGPRVPDPRRRRSRTHRFIISITITGGARRLPSQQWQRTQDGDPAPQLRAPDPTATAGRGRRRATAGGRRPELQQHSGQPAGAGAGGRAAAARAGLAGAGGDPRDGVSAGDVAGAAAGVEDGADRAVRGPAGAGAAAAAAARGPGRGARFRLPARGGAGPVPPRRRDARRAPHARRRAGVHGRDAAGAGRRPRRHRAGEPRLDQQADARSSRPGPRRPARRRRRRRGPPPRALEEEHVHPRQPPRPRRVLLPRRQADGRAGRQPAHLGRADHG